MRSYGQYCSIARALDVVGDRWTLLLVRELLLRGQCRFVDLRNGLPGVAPNLLSVRLKELEAVGLVVRSEAAPPVATPVYELTASGRALKPVLAELAQWGLPLMTEERDDDEFRAEWMAYFPAWFSVDGDPSGPPGAIQLIAGGQKGVIELGDGTVRSHVGTIDNPDLLVEGTPRAVMGLLAGLIDLKAARNLGLKTRGNRELLDRLRPASMS
jgi:DNA-binding HxlR family transcriptional regulator